MTAAFVCAHAELGSAIAGALGGLLLATPYFVEWRHRRQREKRIKRQRARGVAGANDDIDKALIDGSTDAVLAAGSIRALAAGIGAVFLVISFVLVMLSSLMCGR